MNLHIFCIFIMFVEKAVVSGILAAFKSIERRTCIRFKEPELALSKVSAERRFLVFFGKLGKRYLLHVWLRKICMHLHDYHFLLYNNQIFQFCIKIGLWWINYSYLGNSDIVFAWMEMMITHSTITHNQNNWFALALVHSCTITKQQMLLYKLG